MNIWMSLLSAAMDLGQEVGEVIELLLCQEGLFKMTSAAKCRAALHVPPFSPFPVADPPKSYCLDSLPPPFPAIWAQYSLKVNLLISCIFIFLLGPNP